MDGATEIHGTAASGYTVQIYVYIATDATPTQATRDRAQAMLNGLRLPTWPG